MNDLRNKLELSEMRATAAERRVALLRREMEGPSSSSSSPMAPSFEIDANVASLKRKIEEAEAALKKEKDGAESLRSELRSVRREAKDRISRVRSEAKEELESVLAGWTAKVEGIEAAAVEEREAFVSEAERLVSELRVSNAMVERLRADLEGEKRSSTRRAISARAEVLTELHRTRTELLGRIKYERDEGIGAVESLRAEKDGVIGERDARIGELEGERGSVRVLLKIALGVARRKAGRLLRRGSRKS